MLTLLLISIGLLLFASALPLALYRCDRVSIVLGSVVTLAGSAVGLVASAVALWSRRAPETIRFHWQLPMGELHLGLDDLSAFFLLCVFLISGLAALYGAGYLRTYLGRRAVAPALVFFPLLEISMVTLVLARDAVLFLAAWELMTVASFFLVTFENDREDVRRAGITYLIASQLGVIFVFALFGLLVRESGALDFEAFAGCHPSRGVASICFVLAMVGFGTKAGFWPVHLWLPDAHPAAPSHVSALMSGVMIKMGIYGLLRALTLLGSPPPWWGMALLATGAVSGVGGVLLALAQHDLKRLLAYHSVENIGIIALGLGVGLLGQSYGRSDMALAGYAGALLHVLNHGLFKGLLFQCAGAIQHATGTRAIDRLGGLQRQLPLTAVFFVVGAIAISGLPPLNGFVSEWLMYSGAFYAVGALPTGALAVSLATIPVLALVGGLAAACFVKAYGVIFLGEPRTSLPRDMHEAGPAMRTAMLIAATLCLVIGAWPAGALSLVAPAASGLAGGVRPTPELVGSLTALTRVALALVGIVVLLALVRWLLLRRREVRTAPTWGCGYAAPEARMQYTAASFAGPLLAPFSSVLPRHLHRQGPHGPFPAGASFEEELSDLAGERIVVPLVSRLLGWLGRVRLLQQGNVHVYLVYVLLTLIGLFIWQLGGRWFR